MTTATNPQIPASAQQSSASTNGPVPYPGIRLTTNGNQLVSYYTEARIADAGIFYPITPSTEMGENFQLSFAKGELNVFGNAKVAVETEGEHAAQGGAIAYAVTGKRVTNFTSGQGLLYGLEQYYHAPGKLATMVVEVSARALTKHALNVHCGHDDIYAAFDTGWNITFGIDAQQAADQAVIMRRVNELSLNPGINGQDGFLTSHLERTFRKCESELLREFLGRSDDIIDCPTDAQRELFGPKRRRVPECIDLKNPALLGSVQNQEHYMGGVAARRHHFAEHILGFFEQAYEEWGRLTGRYYGLISEYNNDGAETTFVAIGSAAENCQAAVDYIKQHRGEKVGVVHINVLRPCPEQALVKALAGKKRVIVLERTDDQLAGDGPLARDIRTALSKAVENSRGAAHSEVPTITPHQMPRIYTGVYGLGSRDFRPEGILGAYEFVIGEIARQDGRKASDGTSFFYVGINHPYNVVSAIEHPPSLLPDHAIAIRFHSIGGWGMITTGKNLSEMLGDMGQVIAQRDHADDPEFEALHVSANPKYGSEKKGAPTNYFLVAAPKRIRTNCDLHHVSVVLCCDPKIFTHTNPLLGLEKGGAFVWESGETDDRRVWERIPQKHRQWIMDNEIRLYVLNGFKIARELSPRADLIYRMQGNSFLGAFFRVSTFLRDNRIEDKQFLEIVADQYEKKFARFGPKVVSSNMKVMQAGFEQVRQVPNGDNNAPDTSSMRGERLVPLTCNCEDLLYPDQEVAEQAIAERAEGPHGSPGGNGHGHGLRPPLMSRELYDSEFRSDYGYNQPSSPHAATGAIAAATGETTSKYVSRRQVPVWIPENCTQCMHCITACPDTALPNTAQDVGKVLDTALYAYVENAQVRQHLRPHLPNIEAEARQIMREHAGPKVKDAIPFQDIVAQKVDDLVWQDPWFEENKTIAKAGVEQFKQVFSRVPWAYTKTSGIFQVLETKEDGQGGLFGIFVNDRCKGCGECVEQCGDHGALVMEDETEQLEGLHASGVAFLDLLPNTQSKYLGRFNPEHPEESRTSALMYHLMVRDNYEALRSGDGACAGCGEKTILRALATISEAYLRPVFHAKADRMDSLADELEERGLEMLGQLSASDKAGYQYLRKTILHMIMGYGGENEADTDERIAEHFKGSDADLIDALRLVLRQDAFNHRDVQAVDGGKVQGMSVMAMTASTGCNTVFGSTHPSNPHPYPWMNSLFQDGATIGWLVAESFMYDHARRSVVPERVARRLLSGEGVDKNEYFQFTHFTDTLMTDAEINELPRVWAIGGDGAFGDIGFQNVSKAVLQNRPNLQILLLDTQVYSNTGGQNSDSSPMPGGFDMNQFGPATEGKMTEMKGVAETFTSGHGSPYVAQVSMANSSALYASLLDAMTYRGTGFIQAYTTCQPEHGVGDHLSTGQAKLSRDSRGLPEFVFNPSLGEAYTDALSLKGNPAEDRDWWVKRLKKAAGGGEYKYTIANWAVTESRFRNHFYKIKDGNTDGMIALDDILWRVSQQDVVHRRYLDPSHRSYVPKEGVFTLVEDAKGQLKPIGLSRHMVLFCVERRKAWRMLQSKAGIVNSDRLAQQRVLKEFDESKIPQEVFDSRLNDLIEAAREAEKKNDRKTPLMELLP
ncbi:MAG: oxidoreductase [Planctomycetes bacterium]|nr:oxidoreductase [Planctomycetota bacterium]NOG53295.1 oxidoreductase [Planctomycetota bacterium]